MKRGLMSQFPAKFNRDGTPRSVCCKNIGDYIQTVASMQYATVDAELIEQEEADLFCPADKQKRKLIMNGWFQWRAEHWPPSEYIVPLLTSMHFSPLRAKQLFSEKGMKFLRAHQPIGCRDLGTVKLVKERGLECYFSACATLTLGKKYGLPKDGRSGVFFVDPYFVIPPIRKGFFSFIACLLLHPYAILKLGANEFFRDYSPTGFLDRDRSLYRRFYKAACFFKLYSSRFDPTLLLRAKYVTHWLDLNLDKMNGWDCVRIAEDLVKAYGSAKLMVTSRIHAALPCLGMQTPVVFVASKEITDDAGTWNTPGRLGGLLDLFRKLLVEGNRFTTEDEVFAKISKFGMLTSFENKNNWIPYAKQLDKQLSEFMEVEDGLNA